MYRMIKTFLFFLAGITLRVQSFVFAQSTENEFFYNGFGDGTPTTDQGSIVRNDVVNPDEGVVKKIIRVLDLDQYLSLSDQSALEYVKNLLNVILGLTALVAFVIIVFGFSKILFADNDDAITDARKTVQGAAIAIVIIGVSRLLVSFLFTIYNTVANVNG